ncbi:MAG TPA: GH92 family glycosyl hydrolase [Acidobacteriaceae bacterium]|nr:GH92 family glycosyl hydrolase [Acidobacteriaceae bacterium]
MLRLVDSLSSFALSGLRRAGLVCLATLPRCGAAIAALIVLSAFGSWAIAQSGSATSPADSVNPLIGTGTGPGDTINLFPGPTLPFGMVQLSPDTEDRGFGYHYAQAVIHGFSMTHMSGVGCPNDGEVFFTATTGPVKTQVTDFQSPYSHSEEAASPGYYRVRLARWNISAELSATDRTGIVQFTFPAGQPANILVPISHTLNHTMAASIRLVGDHEVEGYVENQAFCNVSQTYKVYFDMTFSRPFSSYGTWNGAPYGGPGTVTASSRSASQDSHDQWIGAYATWPASSHSRAITARIGISYVDQAGASDNLRAESKGKSFSAIRHEAESAWNKALRVIDVSGGMPAERTVFYTALYHSLMMPSLYNDADGRYLGFDDRIHHVVPGHNVYDNYSGWDIYRSQMPLVAMIDPQRMQDIAASIALMYQQGGWVGRWPQVNRYTNVMAGSPLSVVLATAWLDGLHGFDMDTAWKGMLLDATQAPPPGKPYAGEAGIDWINKIHYVPNDKVQYGSVSQMQEDSIAYASLYYLAKDLGKTADAKMLYQRALGVRNVFDPQDRFFRPRNADGQWVPKFDPNQEEHGFIEGSGWHYQWFVPSDLAWLVQAVGREPFNQRLTQFFSYPKPGWYGQYYNPYNETDLEAPFEFNFSGEPWQSQRVVRRVLKENYTNDPNGIPGNDDCGEMSSWAVFSMMGLYPVDPASLAYELVSPLFPKVVIHLHAPYSGKDFTIEAGSVPETNPYIQSVQFNGQAHDQDWISFHDIAAGGTLHFNLGATPNRAWAAGAQDAPPSLSQSAP